MDKEFPLARAENKGQPVLLAIASSGERITTSYNGDKRTQNSFPPEFCEGGEAEDTETESKSSRKAKGANAGSSKKKRRGRDNKDRKQHRGDEGEDKLAGRSARKLGIIHPGSYCDESEIVPHYWVEVDNVHRGILFQCRLCLKHLWLPSGSAEQLSKLIMQYGKDEGYCRYLNRHRAAKILMAKLQDLRRLEEEVEDKREFARIADRILSDKEYDRNDRNV